MNILVIAAHPDDEVLGCGGTIARLAREGHNIHIAVFGEGITSRYDRREQADPSLVRQLRDRCHSAAQLLGAKDLYTYNLPDNRFDTVPLLEIVKMIEAVLKKTLPQVVYTHHRGDLNVDHRVIHHAALTATRPVAGASVRTVYAFEVPSSTDWAFHQMGAVFTPSVYVNIEETLGIKLEAMERYESEACEFPHPRSREALRAAAWRWGSVAGLGAAEAFELIRDIR